MTKWFDYEIVGDLKADDLEGAFRRLGEHFLAVADGLASEDGWVDPEPPLHANIDIAARKDDQ